MITLDPVTEGLRLVALAEAKGFPLRLLGGVAVRFLCPSAEAPPLSRPIRDLDLLSATEDQPGVVSLLQSEGYVPDHESAVPGVQLFFHRFGSRQVELYLDRIPFGPGLYLRPALRTPGPTIPSTLLLTSKLLIAEPREKDLVDMVALVVDHPEAVHRLRAVIDQDPPLAGLLRHGLTQVSTFARHLPEHLVIKIDSKIAQLVCKEEHLP